jgi:hypothetical protein
MGGNKLHLPLVWALLDTGAREGREGLTGLKKADGVTNKGVMLLCFLVVLPPISLRTYWQAPQPALCVLLDPMAPPAVCDCCAISAPGMILLQPDLMMIHIP